MMYIKPSLAQIFLCVICDGDGGGIGDLKLTCASSFCLPHWNQIPVIQMPG